MKFTEQWRNGLLIFPLLLKSLTVGCETVDMTLRRNGLGQLGFHVRLDGTVAEVLSEGHLPRQTSCWSAEILICVTSRLHISGLCRDFFFIFHTGGGVWFCLAGRVEARQPVSGDLQSSRSHPDSWADDWPAEDVGHSQSGHHSSLWRGGASQVCLSLHALFSLTPTQGGWWFIP